jgi:hypothetical protein
VTPTDGQQTVSRSDIYTPAQIKEAPTYSSGG